MQAPLALIGSFLALLSWVLQKSSAWLVGGLLLFSVVPFTLLAILPTNRLLEGDHLDLSPPEAERLLHRWGRLHAVRSLASFLAFITLLTALAHR
jgi:hypothetical protein